jgi:azurin
MEIRMLRARPLACVVVALSVLAPLEARPSTRESVAGARSGPRQAGPRVVAIEVGDNMRFSVAAIAAKPGEPIKIVLKGVGQMPKVAMGHNFILLKKGTDAKAFAEKSGTSRETEFIAPAVKDQVLASTHLVGPGETVETTFNAPKVPGDYTYLCSFPGHFALGMKGILTVK